MKGKGGVSSGIDETCQLHMHVVRLAMQLMEVWHKTGIAETVDTVD